VSVGFVLSGGAALGAAQVGMLLALSEAGVRPDLIVGTSVGAVNGGWLAGRSDPQGLAELAQIWTRLHRHDIFPTHPLLGLSGFLGRSSNLFPNSGLRRLLKRNLRFERLEQAPIPLHVTVTDVLKGTDVCLSQGDAIEGILASAAIPGVFPPVRIAGRDYMDGGVVNNTPISHAAALGATEIWVLSTGQSCALAHAPKGALAMALQALSLAINQRLAWDVERYEASCAIRVVPPLCPVHTSPADFSHGAELIARARADTHAWLRSGPPQRGQAVLIAPHAHH
jgi:NTE family protein